MKQINKEETEREYYARQSHEQHHCRCCKSFTNCISMVESGSMARCMYWNEIKNIAAQMEIDISEEVGF